MCLNEELTIKKVMKTNWIKLGISLAFPLFVGYLGSTFTISGISNWYIGINKPPLTPPNSVFGPVWTILYFLMGFALYLVLNKRTNKNKTMAIIIFTVQLGLNLLWSFLFFTKHWLLISVMEILILWAMILVNILVFNKYSKLASIILTPYLIWVTFASYLTFTVWYLN
jgi:tryptophan-rich sensory protein